MTFIWLNDEKIKVTLEHPTIETVLVQQKIDTKGIAIALNNNIIASHKWPSQILHDQDKLLLVRATQGG